MKKILIASCLVIALCTGCKKPAPPVESAPIVEPPTQVSGQTVKPAEPIAAAGQTAQPTTAAGQTVPSQTKTVEGQTVKVVQYTPPPVLPPKERCALLQKEYFPVQLDRLRITAEYKAKMLDVYKKAGKPTGDANVQVGKLAQEMEQKLNAAVVSRGFKSSADMNPEGCTGFQANNQDPAVAAQFNELANKLAEIDKAILAITGPATP